MNYKRIAMFTMAVFVTVTATSVGGVTAQEIGLDIEFEEDVTVGNETSITHVATVEEASAEVDAEVDLTMFVNGEEVDSKTFEERIVEGKTVRTEFTHTFESGGENEVSFDGVVSALGQELEDSVTETVEVESDEEMSEDDSMEEMDENESEHDDSIEEMGENESEQDDSMGSDSTDGESENDTEGTEDDGSEDEEGLAGFGFIAAIASLLFGGELLRRRSE